MSIFRALFKDWKSGKYLWKYVYSIHW